MLNHCGTVRLETNRLILRPFVMSDGSFMYKNWASDDEVTKFLTWQTHQSVDVTERLVDYWCSRYSDKTNYHWAIELKEIKEPIGSITLMRILEEFSSCEIGYCIGRPWWGQGLTTEALEEILKFGFETVGFERMAALHEVSNLASGRVMIKAGLSYEGTIRKARKNGKGIFVDCKQYAIIKEDYQSKN